MEKPSASSSDPVTDKVRKFLDDLSRVSHEIGQPATVLLTSLELLQSKAAVDPALRADMLKMSLEAAENLRLLLQELTAIRHAFDSEWSSAEVK
jgi:signal transduction histidine kinase